MSERFDLINKNGYGIIQNKKWFSYGVDAVLLSHFTEIETNDLIVDLGTGNGIIPLLLNLNYEVDHIYGIEKQNSVAEMARASLKKNKTEKISIIESDVLDVYNYIRKGTVDVVVSNPPYFKKGGAIVSTGNVKAIARHETSAVLEDFIKVASGLLKEKGTFYMVHRPSRLVDIFYYCRLYKLEPKIVQFVRPDQNEVPNILLIKCVKSGNPELIYKRDLCVYTVDRKYTDEIKDIYKSLQIDVF